METCRSCSDIIFDKYFLKIKDFSFHEECLSCSVCYQSLENMCYYKLGKFYCKIDYEREFREKCGKCSQALFPDDLVIRNSKSVFHFSCFSCSVCGLILQQGDEYKMQGNNEILCKNHFTQKNAVSTVGSDYVIDVSRQRDGRRGPKRPRTILTACQRRQFKASFEISPKPCRKVREALAKETGLSVRVVQVWFQNQRAKMKKMQRRGKLCPQSNKQGSKLDNDNISDDSEDDFVPGNDSNYEEDLLDQSVDRDETNPIDKLYMMQDSYFAHN